MSETFSAFCIIVVVVILGIFFGYNPKSSKRKAELRKPADKNKIKESKKTENSHVNELYQDFKKIIKEWNKEREARIRLGEKVKALKTSISELEQLNSHTAEEKRKYFGENIKLRKEINELMEKKGKKETNLKMRLLI
ncbi:MAG: hypothetical protein I3273_06530 [Candidatus Moeniiplasma glomeromycotorum]|nr:hypothetical protein [Candidatus Moeniiplasma glomeromycotorum]MCE8168474.1 hypothetical protein [Candidatus Moeniiplasma glomeromycotorum]MCE8169741.1 hypothetical protein [Candidatus Moeniiplasma glomeromycotorum]